MMMNGMIREKKKQQQNMGHFFNFSTVMPMRFYLDGDVRYLAFFFIGEFFKSKRLRFVVFFIFVFRRPFKTT